MNARIELDIRLEVSWIKNEALLNAWQIQSKTHQFYGFVGETNYNEAFIEELSCDWEKIGYGGCDIPLQRDERIVLDPEIAHGKPVI